MEVSIKAMNTMFMNIRYMILIILSSFIAFSCNKEVKETGAVQGDGRQEIVLFVGDGNSAVIETKIVALVDVPSTLYWGATTGSANESAKYSCSALSVSDGSMATGRYQTYPATAYNHYVANYAFNVGASTTMTVPNNNLDIVAGRIPSSTSPNPSVTLEHIFARTGSFNGLAPEGGYIISNLSFTLVGKSSINGIAGVYNLTDGSWSSATSKLVSPTAVTGDSDLYLIPGVYTVGISFTLTKDDWVKNFTQTGDITLVAGKVNNITCQTSISDEPQPIRISVELASWSTNDIVTNVQ